MTETVNAYRFILLLYTIILVSSCKNKDFNVDYYRETEGIISDSSNIDVVISELVNNGFKLEADTFIEKTDWENFFKSYKSSSILDFKTIEVNPDIS